MAAGLTTSHMGHVRNKSGAVERLSIRRKILFSLVALCIGLVVAGLLTEGIFRVIEYRAKPVKEGTGGRSVADARWGWKPEKGWFRVATFEFDSTGHVNELFMNDEPYDPAADASRTRVLVLGDSHTLAVGVSMEETWPKVLQRRLNSIYQTRQFRCYNAAAVGYSLHQYLLRLVDQGPVVKPHYVMVGLSYATDLYDLLPPDHGGWTYGRDAPRDYFDFDESGQLVELHWPPDSETAQRVRKHNIARSVRVVLQNFATFRYMRRTKIALWVGSKVKIGGQSMWPNMEVVVEKHVTKQHEYSWRLAQAVLARIHEECHRQNAKLIVVGIPYLPQVYDDIWKVTFGGDPRYSRTAAIDRMSTWCESESIVYVDTLDAFRAKTKELDRWLHYRRDAHPTAEGHEVIADTIVQAGVIEPRRD